MVAELLSCVDADGIDLRSAKYGVKCNCKGEDESRAQLGLGFLILAGSG